MVLINFAVSSLSWHGLLVQGKCQKTVLQGHPQLQVSVQESPRHKPNVRCLRTPPPNMALTHILHSQSGFPSPNCLFIFRNSHKANDKKTDICLKELRLGENAQPLKGQLCELGRGDFKPQLQVRARGHCENQTEDKFSCS